MKNFETCTNLIEMLAWRATASQDKTAFTFKGEAVSFGRMWADVNQFAAFLLEQKLQRADCVVVVLPNSAEFFTAFYGIQRAGGIAVPFFPEAGAERILSLAKVCGARLIIVPSTLSQELLDRYRQAGFAIGVSVHTVLESSATELPSSFPIISTHDTAFLQYTSGSTGNPKGVMLTHAGLMTNIRQMIQGMEITDRDIFVSWLPVYHDMGLILKTMVPFYLAAEVHLLPTNLRDVHPWAESIQTNRATFTAAPDFAYRLLLRHVKPEAYDLSSLRVALNAAEPVRAKTVADFEQLFHLENVMTAGYGLAEATVGVSMSKPGETIGFDRRGRASVGRPFPGIDIQIRQEGRLLPPGEIGEITISSPANTPGYYQNPPENEKLFREDGYLNSGDLGYLDEQGRLTIVSRKKNIIKRAGETISPQEIEEVVDGLPGVRFSAAVGIDRGGFEGEQVYVFIEVREGPVMTEATGYETTLQVVEHFHQHMGFRPGRVYLVRPRSIPLTHNGKIQHGQLKELYLNGALRKQGAILYPEY